MSERDGGNGTDGGSGEDRMSSGDRGWFDEPRHHNWIWWALCLVCILLVIADFILHRHGHFKFEEWPAFYAAVGFGAFYVIVLAGKQLRKLLMREEDYYDR